MTMDKVQIIRNAKGEAAYAVVPWDEYERLRDAGEEDAQLIRLGNAARHDETFPAEVAKRLVAGEPALKVIREWRGMTQNAVSRKSGVATQYISQIERGARNMGKKVAAKLAKALSVSPDVLLD
jgi:DNA-binding XRE family transcriptional regulator